MCDVRCTMYDHIVEWYDNHMSDGECSECVKSSRQYGANNNTTNSRPSFVLSSCEASALVE